MQIWELNKGDPSSGQVLAQLSSRHLLQQEEDSTVVYLLILKNKPCLSIAHLLNDESGSLSKEKKISKIIF